MTTTTQIQTVLGPVPASALGAVDAHEHLFLRSPALPGEEFVDADPMVEEIRAVRGSGIDTVVELTPIGLGRDPQGLVEVARRTGMQIVAATGFHRDAHYPDGHWVYRESTDTLLEVMLTDLRTGMDGRDWCGPLPSPTAVRAGVIKLGASYQRISPAEHRRLEAGAEAARLTGVAIAVHCEVGTMGPELIALLQSYGIAPGRIALAHMDRNPDPGLHAGLCEVGAFLLYDTIGRAKYGPDSDRIELIANLVEHGYGSQLLLGTDVGRRSLLRTTGGGPGMDVLGREFLPRLTKRLGPEAVDMLMRANPAQFLSSQRVLAGSPRVFSSSPSA